MKKDTLDLAPATDAPALPEPTLQVELRVDVKNFDRLIAGIGELDTVSVKGRVYVDQAALVALLEQSFTVKG